MIPDGSVASNYDITLNGDLYSTLTRFDGSFTFHEIPTGLIIYFVSYFSFIMFHRYIFTGCAIN